MNLGDSAACAPSITFAFYPTHVHWNAGIAQLSAICKSWGIRTNLAVLDWFTPGEFHPPSDIVAFSAVHEGDYRASIGYMRKAKALGKKVILGGVWAGLGKPVDGSVDHVCRGDGEELVEWILGGDERVFREWRITHDLNSLPVADYEIFEGVEFDRCLGPFMGKKVLPYLSSRGCLGRCSFCQTRFQPPGRRIRTKVEEDLMPLLERYRPDGVHLADAQSPYDDPAWKASWGDLRVPFGCYIRADIEPDDLDWLIDRGMQACAFGVEAGDERFRNEVLKKDVTDAQIKSLVDRLRHNGVFYIPFYMTGIPGEGWIEQTRTLQAMKRFGGAPMLWQYQDLGGL